MTFEEFRRSQPVNNWVVQSSQLNVGDKIAFWYAGQYPVRAKVVDIISDYIIQVKQPDGLGYFFYTVNLTQDVTFILSSVEVPPPLPRECTCGAKHTSNPNFHLPFCELND